MVHHFQKISIFFRKFNDSVATCHADARVKSISWLKDGTELVGQCEDCSELELFIQLFPDEYAFYECHVNETTGDETKLVDIGRFPGHENYTVSWFECCGGVSFIYLHLDLVKYFFGHGRCHMEVSGPWWGYWLPVRTSMLGPFSRKNIIKLTFSDNCGNRPTSGKTINSKRKCFQHDLRYPCWHCFVCCYCYSLLDAFNET